MCDNLGNKGVVAIEKYQKTGSGESLTNYQGQGGDGCRPT
jgi:hypothetical protein